MFSVKRSTQCLKLQNKAGVQCERRAPRGPPLSHTAGNGASRLKAEQTLVAPVWARDQGGGRGEQLGLTNEVIPEAPSTSDSPSKSKTVECPRSCAPKVLRLELSGILQSMPVSLLATHTLCPASSGNGFGPFRAPGLVRTSTFQVTAPSQGPCHCP